MKDRDDQLTPENPPTRPNQRKRRLRIKKVGKEELKIIKGGICMNNGTGRCCGGCGSCMPKRQF